MKLKYQLFILPVILLLFVVYLSTYVVKETDQVIITRFGEVRGEPVEVAGLHWKMPFIDEINRIEKRYLGMVPPARCPPRTRLT